MDHDGNMPSRAASLAPTYFIDADHPEILAKAAEIAGSDRGDTRSIATKLFYFVRDSIKLSEFVNFFLRENCRASAVLRMNEGNCTGKAVLLCALARTQGIPARLNFVDMLHHRLRKDFSDLMGTHEILYHGRTELFLAGHWVTVTPGFGSVTCSRLGVPSVEFDGIHDALLPPLGLDGQPAFIYTRNHGFRDDYPFEEIKAAYESAFRVDAPVKNLPDAEPAAPAEHVIQTVAIPTCSVNPEVRMERVYLDHNSTTPLDPLVRDAMFAILDGTPMNPSNIHSFGQRAANIIEEARTAIASAISAQTDEIVFTSGGTESNNLAILGVTTALTGRNKHIITSSFEHSSVLNTIRHLESHGWAVTYVQPDDKGIIDPQRVADAVRDETVLVSIMLANNEVGAIQPIREIAAVLKGTRALLHTDAVQAFGKLPLDAKTLGVDLLSLSSHKLYGPQGVGALFVRRGVSLASIMHGGLQEHKVRPGTENVAGILGFGKAAELAISSQNEDAARLKSLRDAFESSIIAKVDGVTINGHPSLRVPNTSNVSIAGVDGGALVVSLDLAGIAISARSACSSMNTGVSHVLSAMGRTPDEARSSIRVSFGKNNTLEDVDRVVETIRHSVIHLRKRTGTLQGANQ